MKVVLAFPWRETPDRLEAWEVTNEVVRNFWPFDAIAAVDSGHQPFNRSATRNLCNEWAKSLKADVVVINDADSIPEQPALEAAITGAYEDGLMHFPFHEAWYVERKAIYRFQQPDKLQSYEQLRSRIIGKCPSEGGIWVCRPETWDRAGGMDDRLSGWGCDDRAFLSASRTLVGPPVKHNGFLICLPHLLATNRNDAWLPDDVNVLVRYQEAYQKPEEMREIIDERRAYLSSPESRASQECSPTIRIIS